MASTPRRITGQLVFDTAKTMAAGGHRLDFAAALMLCQIVLRMLRRGFLERGGYESGRQARVASVLNLTTAPPSWTTSVQVAPGKLVANLVTASDEAVTLVAQHLPGSSARR